MGRAAHRDDREPDTHVVLCRALDLLKGGRFLFPFDLVGYSSPVTLLRGDDRAITKASYAASGPDGSMGAPMRGLRAPLFLRSLVGCAKSIHAAAWYSWMSPPRRSR